MDSMNEIMEDDGYAGYEADPLDENFQVKCGQILVSASQKFSLRCAGCDMEYDTFREFISHCIEMHSFTDFEIDSKSQVSPRGRKIGLDPNEDSNASNIITMGPPACGSLDVSRNSFETNDDSQSERPNINKNKPLIRLKPLEMLQQKRPNSSFSEDDVNSSPRKRAVYDNSTYKHRFQCKYCDKSYPYSSSLSKHRNTFHHDIKKFQCTFCNNRFTEQIYLIRHQRARHKNELQPYAEDPVIVLENFKDEATGNGNNGTEHSFKQEQTEDEFDQSSINDSSIDKNNSITYNLNRTDVNNQNRMVALISNLNRNINIDNIDNTNRSIKIESNSNKNNNNQPKIIKTIYKCTMCPEEANVTFRSKKEWIAHENQRHLQPEKFFCQICNVGYPSKKLFQDHEQEKHQDQRPYKCPICFFAFKERKHLMRHERVHTGEKPFKCLFCIEQFTRKDALKTHHAKDHPDIPLE